MLYGRVVRPPAVGAAVASLDESSVRQISGLVKVVVRNNFVGVVAEKQAQAIEAARRLKVDWKPGAGLPPQKTFFYGLRKQPSRDVLVVDSKDVAQRLASAPTRSIVAKLLDLPLDSVRVIYVRGSGCYGLNGADAVSFDAAVLSHARQACPRPAFA